MGWLAPLFLFAALTVALPIWLHRLKTKSSDRQPFSSAMLLETTEQQVHVQKKLKYLLLLALRVALLLLLALAFAKPFLERPPAAIADAGAGTHLIVLDTSVSMGRSGVFEQGREEVRRAIDDAPAGAVIQLIAADGVMRLVRPASTDKPAQRTAVSSLSPTSGRLDFGQLMAEIERYASSLPAPRTLHLISDFQASAMPVQFADVIPAGVASFVPHVVGTGDPVNWSIAFVRQTADGVDVSVRNEGLLDRTVDVQLRINGERAGVKSATGQGEYLLRFTELDFAEGDNRITVTLDTDDDLDADNQWHAVVSNDPPLPVPLLTAEPSGLPVTYLSAALASLTDANFEVEPLEIGDFDPRVLSRYRWAIIDDVGAVDPLLARQLDELSTAGLSLLVFTGDRSIDRDALPVRGHRLRAAGIGSGKFLAIGRFDAQHPALSATEGWHRIHVSRTTAIELDADDEVLMRLENGEPFMLEQRRGDGRLLLVLSAIDNSWNDLPVHPVFVGFMIEVAQYLSGRDSTADQYTIGDVLPLSKTGSASGQIIDPDGNSVLDLADTREAQAIRLDIPGIYAVYTAQGEALVAANIDPRESELGRISQSVLDRWRDATYSKDQAVARDTVNADSDPVALWPWLLLLLAVVAIAESALGNVHLAMRT